MFATPNRTNVENTPPPPSSPRPQHAQLDATSKTSHEVDEHRVLLDAFNEVDLVQTNEEAQMVDDNRNALVVSSITTQAPSTATSHAIEEYERDLEEGEIPENHPLRLESNYIAGAHASPFPMAPTPSEDDDDDLDVANLGAEFEYNDIVMEDISQIESEDLDVDAAYIATLENDNDIPSTNLFRTSTPGHTPSLGFGNILGLEMASDGFVANLSEREEEQKRIKRELEEEEEEEEEEVPMTFHEVHLSVAEMWLYEDPILAAFRCKGLSHLRKSWTRDFEKDGNPYDHES